MILSSRVEALELMLQHVSASWDDSELTEAAEEAGADASHEMDCWTLLLDARGTYMHWASVIREQDREPPRLASSDAGMLELPGADGVTDVAVRQSAEEAMANVEEVLTFQVEGSAWYSCLWFARKAYVSTTIQCPCCYSIVTSMVILEI